MKKALFILCIAILAPSVQAQRQSSAKPDAKLEFATSEHDFGKVAENGKKVTYTFQFTNTGTTPLVITRITTTCKCVDYSFSKKPVMPGEKGEIKVTYNPKKQEGVFYKVIQVYANTADPRHIIAVRGEVVE